LHILKPLGFALAGLLLAGPTAAEIVVGQTAGFSGPVAASVTETTQGAKLVIDAVNKAGGIGGERIELVSLDDKFDPKLAEANARTLLDKHKPVALFLVRGTPHTQAVMPLAAQAHVPLVAPSTGAMVLHEPVNPWVFNVRAPYQREAERAVAHLASIGVTRIGLIHVEDSFGADVLAGAMRGLDKAKLQPLFVEKFDRKKWDFSAIAPKVAASGAQAVFFIGSGKTVADGVAAIRAQGSRAQVVTISNNASSGFIELLGDYARGVIVTQVFPYERALTTGFVREAVATAKDQGLDGVTPAMLEGYAAAKVLVAGLKRAARPITGDSLQRALDNLGRLDLGGLELDYSPTDHTGLEFVDLSIVGPAGKFRR